MTNEEMKKKIVEVVLNSEITGIQIRAITGGYSMANNIAEALIAAGLKFDVLTETEYQKYCAYKIIEPQIKGCLDREKELEKRLAEAEHRAEIAEKALDLCETAYILSLNHRATEGISGQAIASDLGVHKFFMEQAEKELAEEQKHD